MFTTRTKIIVAGFAIMAALYVVEIVKASTYKKELHTANERVVEATSRADLLEANLKTATETKVALETRLSQAAAQRERLRRDYEKRLAELKVEPIPQTCEGAFDWIMENTK